MMKNTFSKKTYKCNCGSVAEEFVWDKEIEKYKFSCSACSKELGYEHLDLKKKVEAAAIRTPTKNR